MGSRLGLKLKGQEAFGRAFEMRLAFRREYPVREGFIVAKQKAE
jgi:hypothetical protein